MDGLKVKEILNKLRVLESEKQNSGCDPQYARDFVELLAQLKVEFDTDNIILSDSFCTDSQVDEQVLSRERKHKKVIKGGKSHSVIKSFQYQVFKENE